MFKEPNDTQPVGIAEQFSPQENSHLLSQPKSQELW